MSKRFEVRIRGRRAIACETRAEADDWAAILTTPGAHVTIHDTTTRPAAPPADTGQQPSIFDHLEDHTP